jgi:hypothetical protein
MTDALVEWAAACRPVGAPDDSGDQYLVAPFAGGVLVAVADGLGHGPHAAAAARTAVGVLADHAHEPVTMLVKRCHERLRDTRGVVLSVASFADGIMSWLGVGDVDGVLLRAEAPGMPEPLLVRAGVVGRHVPALEATPVQVSRGDVLVVATDGVRSGFAEGLPPVRTPQGLADRILAEHAKATDDALVVVARYRGATA